ncbi:unnamed protein product, partial [Meganyctiphanes norvegica]
ENVTRRASALYDYVGSAPDELTFNAGDDLEIHGEVSANEWITAYNKRSSQSGLIPGNYVNVLPEPDKTSIYDTTIVTDDDDIEEVYELTISTNMGDEDDQQSHINRTHTEIGTVLDDHHDCTDNNMTQEEFQSSKIGTVLDDHHDRIYINMMPAE